MVALAVRLAASVNVARPLFAVTFGMLVRKVSWRPCLLEMKRFEFSNSGRSAPAYLKDGQAAPRAEQGIPDRRRVSEGAAPDK